MGVIEEDPLRIESGSRRKRNSRDMEKAYDEEEEETNKKKIIKESEIIMSLTDQPSDVLVDILARLPLRTLFVARSVCKTFGFLTTANPDFIKVHSSKATQILIFQFRTSHTPSHLIHMADNELDSQPKPPLFQLPKVKGTYFLVNSCNGLLYLRRNKPDGYGSLVCNPVTSEYITIPDAVVDPKTGFYMSLWLGFSPGTNEYKLLRILRWKNADPGVFAAQVYVIGSDSWRDIGGPRTVGGLGQAQLVNGLMYWLGLGQAQLLLNGLMYWLCVCNRRCPGVISFDFESEKFGEVALPSEFQDKRFTTGHYTSIGVLGGCPCLSCNDSYAHRVDLWVMRKCGNQESWTKEFVVDTVTLGPSGQPVFSWFKPLQFLGNGEILMLWGRNALVCYDLRTNSLRCFRDVLGYRVGTLTPSFVPLKDALKVDKVLTQLRPRFECSDVA